jgi:tripartite-type tricarboxylate transporter receptor subunit TctC
MRMDKLLNHLMSLVPSPRGYWLLFFVSVFQLGLSPAKAQNYPSKSVKIVVPSAPGGGTDIVGRLLAQSVTYAFNQSFFVEN